MLYELTKFHCLNVFTSRDIGQYVYCNYLLTRLWCHKFWNFTYLFNQAVFRHDQKSKIKIWKGETKNIFLIFKRLSVAKNCLRLESTPLKDLRNFILRIISVVIILLNTGLYKPASSTYSFGKLVFCLSTLFVFSACSMSNSM